MALRSRSRTANPTSGPGRGPSSDGRTRHRRAPARGGRARHRHASADELRRRAEALFAERAGEWRESGKSPPGGEARAVDGLDGSAGASPAASDAGGSAEAVRTGEAGLEVGLGAVGRRRAWAGLALRERMPVWVQTRCGLERRSVLALSVLLVLAAVFAVQHFWAGRTESVRAPEVVRAAAPYEEGQHRGEQAEPTVSAGAPNAVGTAGVEIVVDVSGKVREPGIHRLPAGSRVADALRAAGGVRPGTNTDGLNRARFLVDGEQVIVGGPAVAAMPGSGGTGGTGVGGPAGSVGGAAPTAPVSLNTATVDQLDTLPGVGPVLAQHILDYRTQHGGFRSVDELREVNGIGDRRFADLRNLVRP
ncbi:helix-hairpin-helix domain-containing protein [Streptomyces sp. NPDC058678]|uniref:helix-hairpin-helix domain-containing protein n=1 Tax=Streptomyces sp. NPDC058678 TaxID=3346595 RepID=UPI00364B9990